MIKEMAEGKKCPLCGEQMILKNPDKPWARYYYCDSCGFTPPFAVRTW